MRDDIKYWVAISSVENIGPKRFKKIYSYFSSMQAAWESSASELKLTGLEEKMIAGFLEMRKKIKPDEEMMKLDKEKIRAITILDDAYPALLKEIYLPPAILYYKGKISDDRDRFAVGVVGTTKFSTYGKQIVENLIPNLAKRGITIVSGMALGIDTLAHKATIGENGRTIAVLGSGLAKQRIYPSVNRYLVDRIIEENGLIVSEYHINMLPLKQNFPQRNRIISGLSAGIMVIEAPEQSGALITARCALEQNRDVFAVPGDIFRTNSTGPHNLIKMGAKLVSSADDVLEALNLRHLIGATESKVITADNEEEKILLQILSLEPRHINEIIKLSGLDTPSVGSTITLMEMKGKVRNLGGMMYIRAR